MALREYSAGQRCPGCGKGKLTVRQHKANWSPKLRQTFYYRRWYMCDNCGNTYNNASDKVHASGAPFAPVIEALLDDRRRPAPRPNAPAHTKHNNPCILKAEDDEPVFVLRGQDESSPEVILLWLSLNPQIPEDKFDDAIDTIKAMRRWPKRKEAD